MSHQSEIIYEWRGMFAGAEVSKLHAEGFEHQTLDINWRAQAQEHSLGWVCARQDEELVGFVNVAWDGGVHAFLLDTLVSESARRTGIGTELVAAAEHEARAAGCEWLHVDFEEHLRGFYLDVCGFRETPAGVTKL